MDDQTHVLALEHEDRVLRGGLVRQRIIHGLSRKEVARRMGVDSRDIEKFEEGKVDWRASTLRRYCLAVGVLIDWQLFVPKDDPTIDPALTPEVDIFDEEEQ